MRILITGAKGQLGYDMEKRLALLCMDHKGIDIDDCDLADQSQTLEVILGYQPDCVVHCAAYTAVDKAEDEPDICFAVNVEGTRNVARACEQLNAKMLYLSTDYVFPGDGDQPFEVGALKRPLNVYGKTKLQGERIVRELVSKYFIVRTSWVFGVNGHNFVKTMLRLGKEREQITVVNDQVGSPTYTEDLAALLCDMLQTGKYGIYHATNEGFCSWFQFAQESMRLAGLPCRVIPVTTEAYEARAKRPLNSRLSKRSLTEAGFSLLPTWQSALERHITALIAKTGVP